MSCGLGSGVERAGRVDLDDLGGEVCLIDWGGDGYPPSTTRDAKFHTLL